MFQEACSQRGERCGRSTSQLVGLISHQRMTNVQMITLRCATAQYHQTFCAVKSHSRTLATFQLPIKIQQESWTKYINIAKVEKQEAV